MKQRAAITRIQVERIEAGKTVVVSRGTGALISERLVLTALHVVANRAQQPPALHAGTITLTFPGAKTTAKPIADAHDPDLDWVLLECEAPPAVTPIPLGELEQDAVDIDWETFGFPDANPEGMRCVGEVRMLETEYQGQSALQLFSEEAAAGEGAPVAGLSGAPCIVENSLVGILRSSLLSKDRRNVAGTLFACPIAVILDRLAQSHPSLRLPIPDPCRGLPGLPRADLPPLPYRLLARYEEPDAEVFFGRNGAIRNLYEKLTDPEAPPILLFYGQSGTGKSSLLEAGLFPRLRPTHAIEYRRRSFERGLCGDLRDATADDWLAHEERAGKPMLVVIDQVEEAYTLPKGNPDAEIAELLDKAKEIFLAAGPRPRGRLVISFRKEWLPEVKARVDERGLPMSMLFLERLDRSGIIEVVHGLTKTRRLQRRYGAQVEEELGVLIADDLLEDHGSPIAPTLQIIMSKLWAAAQEKSPEAPKLAQAAYQRLKRKGILLADFLQREIESLPEAQRPLVESGIVDDLLEAHTTSLGTTAAIGRDELEKRYAHVPRESLTALVHELERRYLLTRPASRELREVNQTRLGHDTLAPLVRDRFRRSDRPGQRARRLLEVRAGEWEQKRSATPLDTEDLEQVENGLQGMRVLTDAERRLLEASRSSRRTGRFMLGAVVLVLVGMGALIVVQWMDSLKAQAKTEQDTKQINREKAARHFESAHDEKDLRQALMHLSRAVELAPNDDPRLDTYIARTLHVFTQLPTAAVRVTEESVAHASVSAEGNRVLVLDRSSVEARVYAVDSSDPRRGLLLGEPVRLLDESGAPIKSKLLDGAQLSGDGRWVLATKPLAIWDATTGKHAYDLKIPDGYKLEEATWTHNSKHVVAVLNGQERGMRRWLAASFDGAWSTEPLVDEPPDKRISDLAFILDTAGRPLVASIEYGEKEGTDRARVLDGRTRKPIDSNEPMILRGKETLDIALDPTGTRLVVLSDGARPESGDEHIDIWDIATGKMASTIPTRTRGAFESTELPKLLFVGNEASALVHDRTDRGTPVLIHPFAPSETERRRTHVMLCAQSAQAYLDGRALGCDRHGIYQVLSLDSTLPIDHQFAIGSAWIGGETNGNRFFAVERNGWLDRHALVPRAIDHALPRRSGERLLLAKFTADGSRIFTLSDLGRVALFSVKDASKLWGDELPAGTLPDTASKSLNDEWHTIAADMWPDMTFAYSTISVDGRYVALAVREKKSPDSLLNVRVWDTRENRMDKRTFKEIPDVPSSEFHLNDNAEIQREAYLTFVDAGPSIVVRVGLHDTKTWTPWSAAPVVASPAGRLDDRWTNWGFCGRGHQMLVSTSEGYELVNVGTSGTTDMVPFRVRNDGEDLELIRMFLDSRAIAVAWKSRSYAMITVGMSTSMSTIYVNMALGRGNVRANLKNDTGRDRTETLRPTEYPKADPKLTAFDPFGFRFAFASLQPLTVHVKELGLGTPLNMGWTPTGRGKLLAISFANRGERLVTIMDDGTLREWFVGHHYETKPDWVKDLGALAAGARFSDDETSIEPKPKMLYGPERDEAVARIEKAAQAGDPGAQYVLGHLTGKGVQPTP